MEIKAYFDYDVSDVAEYIDKEIKELVKDNNTLKNMDRISNRLSINNVEDRIYVEIRSVVGL